VATLELPAELDGAGIALIPFAPQHHLLQPLHPLQPTHTVGCEGGEGSGGEYAPAQQQVVGELEPAEIGYSLPMDLGFFDGLPAGVGPVPTAAVAPRRALGAEELAGVQQLIQCVH
jgi:hypothetical protein